MSKLSELVELWGVRSAKINVQPFSSNRIFILQLTMSVVSTPQLWALA